MRSSLSAALWLVSASCIVSCGGSVAPSPATGDPDTGDLSESGDDKGGDETIGGDDTGVGSDTPTPDAPPGIDHGKPSDTYPAFPYDMPQLQDSGGSTLKNPIVVT